MHKLTRIKIGASGEHLPDEATHHIAMLFPQLGVMIGVHSRGIAGNLALEDKPGSPEQLAKAFAGLELAGETGWTLADDFQTQLAVDRRRYPCIDVDFAGVLAELHWTSTPCPWSSASAFGVNFGFGLVNGYGPRNYRGFGLPVRVVGQ